MNITTLKELALTQCLDRMRYNQNLTVDNLFENRFLSIVVPALYDELDEELMREYSFDALKEDILELIKPKTPTQAIAEDKLETWLDS